MKRQVSNLRFALCINNGGYVDDLKVRMIYQVLPDASAARSNYLRIIDETGEDYLFPASYFVLIEVPREAEQAMTYFPNHASIKLKKRITEKSKPSSQASVRRPSVRA